MKNNNKVRFSVTIDKEVHQQLTEKAKKIGVTLNGLFNLVLHEYLKQDEVIKLTKLYETLDVLDRLNNSK